MCTQAWHRVRLVSPRVVQDWSGRAPHSSHAVVVQRVAAAAS
jgi:hypothetical protein